MITNCMTNRGIRSTQQSRTFHFVGEAFLLSVKLVQAHLPPPNGPDPVNRNDVPGAIRLC
jgi:hypothetical protein